MMHFSTCVTRIGMLFFWIACIGCFLYAPYFMTVFTPKKSLNLCVWPMMIDPQVLAEFEQETGIKVYVTYYETNEELYSKIHATHGSGYDLIVPTDYTVTMLIKDKLLKKIDTAQLDFKYRLNPALLGHYYDQQNDYSVPYYTSIIGLGINKKLYKESLTDVSWKLVFDPDVAQGPLCMLDSMRESIVLAAYYAYGTTLFAPSDEHKKDIITLLRKQKQWVDTYTSTRTEELLASGSCTLAVGNNADIWKAAREYPEIVFVVPPEGSFWTIDSCVIPKATKKDELIYKLINFLYRRDVLTRNCNKYGFCPPTTDVAVAPNILCLDDELSKKLHFFTSSFTLAQMHAIWLAVKAY